MLHQAVQLLGLDLGSLVDVILLAHFVVDGGCVQFKVFVEVRKVNFIDNFLIVGGVPERIFSVIRLQHIQL